MKPNASSSVALHTVRENKKIAHGDQTQKLLLPPPGGSGLGFASIETQRLHPPSWILSDVGAPTYPKDLEH